MTCNETWWNFVADMSKRYVVLFLTDVNKDQEEALTQMKVSNQSSVAMPMFKIIDFTKAISVMAEIMCKSEGRNRCLPCSCLMNSSLCY